MFSRTDCCNDSRQYHAKDVILKLRGYIGLDVYRNKSVAGMHVSTFYFYLLK